MNIEQEITTAEEMTVEQEMTAMFVEKLEALNRYLLAKEELTLLVGTERVFEAVRNDGYTYAVGDVVRTDTGCEFEVVAMHPTEPRALLKEKQRLPTPFEKMRALRAATAVLGYAAGESGAPYDFVAPSLEPTYRGIAQPVTASKKDRRNALCSCGSGKKYKRCCRT